MCQSVSGRIGRYLKLIREYVNTAQYQGGIKIIEKTKIFNGFQEFKYFF